MGRFASDLARRAVEPRAGSTQTDATLNRIAELIGCEVDVFKGANPDPTHPIGGANELLKLWFALRTAEDRAKVLDTARTLARLL